MHSKHLFLCLQITVPLSPHQRDFSLHQSEIITENSNFPKSREEVIIYFSVSMDPSTTELLHLRLREHLGREGGKTERDWHGQEERRGKGREREERLE